MANTKSAQKRTRQTARRTARNKSVLHSMKSVIKAAKTAKSSKSSDSASAIKLATSKIMKAASKGVIHKKTAARYVSRLNKVN